MRVRVDAKLCTGHGRCYEIAPDIFTDDERGRCVLLHERVPEEHRNVTRRAEANCPERAIRTEDESSGSNQERDPRRVA